QETLIDISERSSPRYPVNLGVAIKSSNHTMHEKSSDISETGMFVKTSRKFLLNERVTITLFFSFKHQEAQLSFESSVARLNQDGIGVRFKDIAPAKKAALKAFIAGL
ncbi:MAG: PilZ domain-containing protein, partial [Desulfobacteraceae bacterium]